MSNYNDMIEGMESPEYIEKIRNIVNIIAENTYDLNNNTFIDLYPVNIKIEEYTDKNLPITSDGISIPVVNQTDYNRKYKFELTYKNNKLNHDIIRYAYENDTKELFYNLLNNVKKWIFQIDYLNDNYTEQDYYTNILANINIEEYDLIIVDYQYDNDDFNIYTDNITVIITNKNNDIYTYDYINDELKKTKPIEYLND